MLIIDLIPLLRQDLADPDSERFSNAVLARCLERGVFRLSRDLRIALTVTSGEISPNPTTEQSDLILLLGQINACQIMRAATANSHQFRSGDKESDKTSIPRQWANLEDSLTERYRESVSLMAPAIADRTILRPGAIGSVYEQGRSDDLGYVDQDSLKGIA